MHRFPPLNALPAFEATARLGSVTAAARELGRTHSAVSKQLKHLSEDLGGDLFRKIGTGLELTERGARLQGGLEPMLAELAHLTRQLREEGRRPEIRLAVSATLATRWLTPRLPGFYRAFPNVELNLTMSGPSRDMSRRFDLFLSYDRLRSPQLFAQDMEEKEVVTLGDTSFGLVCAPDYPLEQERNGLRFARRLTHAGAPWAWDAWTRLSGIAVESEQTQEHPHHILALEAAAAGLGVSLAEHRLVATDLAAGRLIAPFAFHTVENGFQAGVVPAALHKPAVRDLIYWLQKEAETDAPG